MDEQRTVSFLLETRTRGTEHVSLQRLASTQSKYDGPNQNSTCSVENSLLPCLSNHFKKKEKWSQTMTNISSKRHGCKKKRPETRQIPTQWTDGRTTKYAESLKWYTVGLTSGPSASPRLPSAMMHLTDSDNDIEASSA